MISGYVKLRCVDEYHYSRRTSEDPRSPGTMSPGPLSSGLMSPGSLSLDPNYQSQISLLSNDAEPMTPESPGFQFLKDLSQHIEKTTGRAPSLEIRGQTLTPRNVSPNPPSSPVPPKPEESSDEYSYSTLPNNIPLEKLINKLDKANMSKLPAKCFKTVKIPVIEEEEELDPNDPYPLPSDLEEEKTYLLSKYFMQHFSASFYEMARDLEMNEYSSAASVEGNYTKIRNKSRTPKICYPKRE